MQGKRKVMNKGKRTLNDWLEEHKTELIITGITFAGTVMILKNWDSIKGIFKIFKPTGSEVTNIEMIVESHVAPVLSNNFLHNLTGNKLTATELGNKVWCSAQEINKRIVAAGLATKCQSGGYILTEAGKKLGEVTCKTTATGYSFNNIEWDEIILDIIFSVEELMEIAVKQERARQILAAYSL